MFKNSIKLVKNTKNIIYSSKANIQTTGCLKEKWDLLTAVLVERKPVIAPELTDLEKEFKDYIAAVEYERSLRNETEINLEREKNAASNKKELEELEVIVKNTTQDLIDAWKEEFIKFKPADKFTDSDKSGNVKTVNRKLDKHLVCVIKEKIGNKDMYVLPQAKREEGETLRQCADRVLQEKCGKDLKAHIFGNAPCGFYKYKYPKAVRSEDSVGAKI
ncbi:39S ribosomal protein L46, mitochondrial isoform X2 [Anthonomus grandis grandis]|nr:39S ribosomal protein L46, mitochondrial isoform X2 [Anthonomus grandis grandis]